MTTLTTRTEYNQAMARAEELVQKATAAGGFENLPPEDTAEFGNLASAASKYETEVLKLFPFTGKNNVVRQLEEEMFRRRMKQREMAAFLGVSASRFCDVIRGKAAITMPFAKALHSKLGFDANLILECA